MGQAAASMVDQDHPPPRACVVCGSLDGPLVFDTQLDICGLGKVGFGIRCCAGCGMVQQDPAVPAETLARQYALFSNYTQFSGGEPPLLASTRRMLDLAAGISPGRVYEIGAAAGAALWHFRKAGWTVGGCDPSAKAVAQAWDFNGVRLEVGDEEAALPLVAGADLITLSHVLEHLEDPRASLARIRRALAPSGMLMFEVPCLAAPEANPPGLFTLEHLNYFSETSLAALLARAGFEVVEAVVTADHWPFPVITMLARKTDGASPPADDAVASALDFCDAYVARDAGLWAAVDARIYCKLAPGEPVVVWGAGVHTSMLLERTGLAEHVCIAAITDRDPQKHGHRLGAYEVIAPEQALGLGARVVVSSYFSETEIAAGLIASGLSPERVFRLHHRRG